MQPMYSIRFLIVLVGLIFVTNSSYAQVPVSVASSTAPEGNSRDSGVTAGGDAPVSVGENTAPPAPSSQYTLGAADVIRVNVWKSAELSQTVTIGPDGFVSLPLLGDIHAAGLTANNLAHDLSLMLSSYVVSPRVTVSVVDFRSRQVFVTGQVGKPGAYPLIAPISVLQLIAQAGGLNTFANRKKILILRKTKGNTQELKFNYTSAVHGDAKQNIILQPGDTVIVN